MKSLHSEGLAAALAASSRNLAASSLQQMAEQQFDHELKLPKPLSEFALAEVVEAMRLLNTAARRIDAAQGAMEACRLPFDVQPFRTLQSCLTQAFDAISPIPLANAIAENNARGRQC